MDLSETSAKYPGYEIKFGINFTHACSPVISKVNVELLNAAREAAAVNGRQTNAQTDTMVRLVRHRFPRPPPPLPSCLLPHLLLNNLSCHVPSYLETSSSPSSPNQGTSLSSQNTDSSFSHQGLCAGKRALGAGKRALGAGKRALGARLLVGVHIPP